MPTATLVRGYQPGCIGRIAELHATYYSAAAGFGLAFEAKVARELSAFCEGLDPLRHGLWLAMLDGRIEGSIVIDGTHAGEEGAHLRWFILSDALRGKGMGARLLAEAIAFVDARAYPRAFLWTFSGLAAARHLYEKHGFQLVRSEAGNQWGRVVEEQYFVRERAIAS